MARKQRQRLGEILYDWGVVTEASIQESLQYAAKDGMRIGEALIALGLADEEDVTKALAQQFDICSCRKDISHTCRPPPDYY